MTYNFGTAVADCVKHRMKEIPNDGMIWIRGFFNEWMIMLCSTEALAEVLVTKSYVFRKPEILSSSLGRIIGFGILLSEGEVHKFARRKLAPAFSYRRIKELYPVFWEKSCEAVRAMTLEAARTESGDLELQDWGSRATLDIIGVAGLGRDFGAIQDANNSLVKTYARIMKPSTTALVLVTLRQFLPDMVVSMLPLRQNDDLNKASEQIRTLCLDLIKAKRDKLAAGEQPELDILSTALESNVFTDEQVTNEIMTILVAGHETMAASINWAIYAMCKHPEMQLRLREEIRSHLPALDSSRDIVSVDIDGMPYLNAVCNEVLRCYPVVPSTVREPIEDIKVQGVLIKKGTKLIIPQWGVNRYHGYWGDDAEEFRPDRWLSSSWSYTGQGDHHEHASGALEVASKAMKPVASGGGSTSTYANLTFLHGPRSCIGQSFARAELACLLAAWVGRFEFTMKEMDQDIGWKTGFTLKPGKSGFHVRAKALGGF